MAISSKPFNDLLQKRVILAFFIALIASMVVTGVVTSGLVLYLLGESASLSNLLSYKVSILVIPLFLVLFVVFFFFIAGALIQPFIAERLVEPLKQLTHEIARLRLDELESPKHKHFDVKEVEEIYNALDKHIQGFHSMYDKFDALMLTEHKTGLLRRTHLDESLRHEVFLAQRFNRIFSVMVVRLKKLRDLTHSDNENLQGFTHELKSSIRNSDMLFYINDHLFILIAPQTDCGEINMLAAELGARMGQAHGDDVEFICEFEVGCATYGDTDGKTPNDLLHAAMRNLTNANALAAQEQISTS